MPVPLDITTAALALLLATAGGLASLIAVALLLWKFTWTDRAIVLLIGFAAGALLGAALFDLLPEAAAVGLVPAALSALAGGGTFWIVEHGLLAHHHRRRQHPGRRAAPTAYLVLLGDTVHNFVDGVAIAAAAMASAPLGFVTAMAVFLHEIPQELGDVAILLRGGMARGRIVLFNFLSALVAVAGAALGLVALASVEALQVPLLGFTAGGFLYIAAFNLLPDIWQFARARGAALLAAALGLALVLGLGQAFPV